MTIAADQTMAPAREPVERRGRRHVKLRGHATLPNGNVSPIVVLDLSYEGCGIEIAEVLEPGDILSLAVNRRGVIESHVCWYRDGKAGLIFDPEARTDQAAQRERQSERVGLLAQVQMRSPGKPGYSVRVFDASEHGCRIEFIESSQVGAPIRIKLGELQPIDARVCWIDGGCAGLAFEHPIHPAVFDLLVERMLIASEAD